MLNLEFFDDYGIIIPKTSTEIYLEKVSVNLFATQTIHILQNVFSTVENRLALRTPLIPANSLGKIYIEIAQVQKNTNFENFWLISNDDSQSKLIAIDLSDELYTILPDNTYSTNSQQLTPISFTIVFSSNLEDTYKAILNIYTLDLSGYKTVIQSFDVIAYAEGSDNRFVNILNRFGAEISNDDAIIFPEINPQEPISDEILLNKKRKELVLTHSEIFPFVGSYKALINALNFFGYSNVKLKEYWRNLDTTSPLYNRLISTEIAKNLTDAQSLSDVVRLNEATLYKKTNLFGLFYDITVESDEIDEDGLPKVVETFRFSLSDIIIKIGALKKKLEKDFLPLSAKIVDIVGETIYFGKISQKNWTIPCSTISANVNITPKFTYNSTSNLQLEDLRYLEYLGCTIGNDLTLTNESFLLHHRLQVAQSGKSSLLSQYSISITVGSETQTETLYVKLLPPYKENWTVFEIAQELTNLFRSSTQSFFTNHRIFVESSGDTIRIIQSLPYGSGTISTEYFDVNTGFIDWANYTFPYGVDIDTSNGSAYFGLNGAPLSYYLESFLQFFESFKNTNLPLSDDVNIPVGCPIVFTNTTFDYKLSSLDVTFSDLQTITNSNKLLERFSTPFIVSGYSPTTIVPPFPLSNFIEPSNLILDLIPDFPYEIFENGNLEFESFGNSDFYEGVWTISHDTRNWSVTSGRLAINLIKDFPTILPYSGTYSVELILYSLDGSSSRIFKKSEINVVTKQVDLLCWRRSSQSDFQPNQYPTNTLLSDVYTTLELPIYKSQKLIDCDISLRSFDMLEYYHGNPNVVPNDVLANTDAYTFKNLKNVEFGKLDHLWLGICSPKLFVNDVYEISDNGVILAANVVTNKYVFQTALPIVLVTLDTDAQTYTTLTNTWVLSKESRQFYYYDSGLGYTTPTNYFSDFIDLGDQSSFSQDERFLNLIAYYQTLPNESYIFNEFLTYIKWHYNDLGNLEPFVRFASKKANHEFFCYFKTDWVLENQTNCYELPYAGNAGDLKASFEIYRIDSLPIIKAITIGNMSTVILSSTNLIDLQAELQSLFDEFNFNLVYDDLLNPLKIIATKNANTYFEDFSIVYYNIIGTSYARDFIANPTLLDVEVIKYSKTYNAGTFLYFCADNSQMVGKTTYNWKIIRHFDNYEVNIVGPFMCYLFVVPSEYSIVLQVLDTNGNLGEVKKQSFVKILN